MIFSTVNGYSAQADSGVVGLADAQSSLVVDSGSAVQLLESNSTYLYWVSDAGDLKRGIVTSNPLRLSATETVASSVSSFYVRDIPGFGIAYAYVSGTTIHINVLGKSYTGVWPIERLPDFTFDLSSDLKTISILYMRPGSPVQAFVEYYTAGDTTPQAVAPIPNPLGDSYETAVSVTLTSPTLNKTIRYTLDGTTPTTASTIYTGAITLNQNTTIKAFTTAPGYLPSEVTTAVYVITIPPPPPEEHVDYQISRLKLYDFKMGLYETTGFLIERDI